eukprot:gb/GECH01001715.1/.p1 GENE.gb/GECH01001715.1/~~gb/GECH01001715.1/.p1  ORF type:complete len:397 (+),score=131.71 gb/GECH01001715.1/:1-1191(+)
MGNKRKAKYFNNSSKRRRINSSKGPLPRGMRGIMFTTSASSGRRVADAEREALNLLEEYEDRIEEIEEEWKEKQKIFQERLSKIKQEEKKKSEDVHETQSSESTQQTETLTKNTENNESLSSSSSKNIESEEKKEDGNQSETKSEEKPAMSSVSDAINQELQQIRGQSLFRTMNTACKGVVFIAFSSDIPIPPSEYAKYIMKDLLVKNVPKTRYLCRMVPLDRTCQASLSDVVSTIKPMVQQYIEKGRIRKYGVVLKSRLNTSFPTKECIDQVSSIMPHYNLVDLNSPDIALNVQILKTTAGVSVFNEFDSLAKMNLNVFRENIHETPSKKVKDSAAEKKKEDLNSESVSELDKNDKNDKQEANDDKSQNQNISEDQSANNNEQEEEEGDDDIRLF